MLPLLSAIAIVISLVAAAAAFRAVRHVGRLRSDIHLLARSMDLALKDVAARTEKETATIGEMTTAVAREIDRLSGHLGGQEPLHDQAGKVVQHPSMRRSRSGAQPTEPTPVPEPATVENAYRRALAAQEFDIALQPIVSVALSAATGFEVFASLQLEGGQRFDLRRPAHAAARAEAASFEHILLKTALQASRKRLGEASAAMPMHVAVSDAILADGKQFGALAEMLQFYPDLARSLVLSLPAALLDPAGQHGPALDLLAGKGVRLAAEGWNEPADADDPIGPAGLSFVKITANRLLDRERSRHGLEPAAAIVERAAAANLTIIATDVTSDEDAVGLIDLGIDLMSGPRFGGPKRLKPEGGGGRSGRLALI